jgi:DNA-binding transcriptional MerR regulator
VDKSPDAFRTISEVAEDLDLPQHVLRFWETRFSQIRPLKRGGGRRYYRPDDVDLLRGIRQLLYGQGYTIKGVQRILKEQGVRSVQALGRGEITAPMPPPSHGGAEEDDPLDSYGPDDEMGEAETRGSSVATLTQVARPGPSSMGGLQMSPDAIRRLQGALFELLECQRLIDAVRGAPAQESDGEAA